MGRDGGKAKLCQRDVLNTDKGLLLGMIYDWGIKVQSHLKII
jgi:hypothetical protein